MKHMWLIQYEAANDSADYAVVVDNAEEALKLASEFLPKLNSEDPRGPFEIKSMYKSVKAI